VTPKVKVVNPLSSRLNISITVPDRRLVTIDHLQETPHGEWNGHVTDGVTLPQKFKVVTPISSWLNISITVPDRRLVTIDHL